MLLKTMHELILASGSSRRHSLMDRLNLDYSVRVSNIDESPLVGETPESYVCRIACAKASAVSQKIMLKNSEKINNASVSVQAILAADTIIGLDGEILGKPNNVQDASNILHKLSATEHDVFTALYFINQNDVYQSLVQTKVKFRFLKNEEIEAYCSSEEPYDKAGAYAIQGSAASFVEYISGSYTNVVGLPTLAIFKLLKQAKLLVDSPLLSQQ